MTLGLPRLHLRGTDSTNERARELALAGAPAGTLVTAGEQTAGRGRHGRRWSAPAGSSILMSLVLHSPPPLLPLMAAVAVCDVAGENTLIKWPNDVVVMSSPGGPDAVPAKLAGILVEGRPQQGWAVLGIGLNVAVDLADLPEELRPPAPGEVPPQGARPAATMGRRSADVEAVLSELLTALQRRLAQTPQVTLEAWRARDALRGRRIMWNGGHGVAEGIDGNGRLIVALEQGGHTELGAGEVHLESIGPPGG
jgi:BirA family biotin operon repressor/biotin-[acetyl-CoA-carboxylase] ligase